MFLVAKVLSPQSLGSLALTQVYGALVSDESFEHEIWSANSTMSKLYRVWQFFSLKISTKLIKEEDGFLWERHSHAVPLIEINTLLNSLSFSDSTDFKPTHSLLNRLTRCITFSIYMSWTFSQIEVCSFHVLNFNQKMTQDTSDHLVQIV